MHSAGQITDGDEAESECRARTLRSQRGALRLVDDAVRQTHTTFGVETGPAPVSTGKRSS